MPAKVTRTYKIAALFLMVVLGLVLRLRGFGRTGYYFPHDEMNDMGLREAIAQICDQAPEGASVGGETAPVFAYYFHKFGREDLR